MSSTVRKPVNILLVDDKQENLLALEELLRQPDRQLFRAQSGNDALRLLLKHELAMVLLDVEMPGMDGYEVAQLMRSAERTRLIPIIFVTAGDRSEERTFRGYEAGAVDFLYKPINAHTLKSKVAVFSELYRKTQELALVNAQLVRATVQLQEKVADLENVSQTLSHDLRAPLRSIRAFSQVLSESLAGKLEEENADALERVLKGASRMSQMIDDLFGLLRLSANEWQLVDVAVDSVLSDVVDNLGSDIKASGATVTWAGLPPVRANRMLLTQVFQNLIANSIKFRRAEPPQIAVSAKRRDDAWELWVTDNGVGIGPDDRDRVFRLFERITNTATGTGVGLALCKRAVEKLGGRIWIDGEHVAGAKFCFTIPHLRNVQQDPQ
ncbi:MAG: response receiver sensor histidine kinase [Myxococcales bacterium]|nr:response receiver sensor histidine kinase [Myxococcales bacterium]